MIKILSDHWVIFYGLGMYAFGRIVQGAMDHIARG